MLIAFILIAWFGLGHCPTIKPVTARGLISWVVFILACIWWLSLYFQHPLPLFPVAP